MAIEWFVAGTPSTSFTVNVLDNTTNTPTYVVSKSGPIRMNLKWEMPSPLPVNVNEHCYFRVRAFAESIGPGPEIMLGEGNVFLQFDQDDNLILPVDGSITIDPLAVGLLAEGESDASGNYKVTCVVQLFKKRLNPNFSPKALGVVGCADNDVVIMLKA